MALNVQRFFIMLSQGRDSFPLQVLESLSSLKHLISISILPFLVLHDRIIAARGRGGGLALWGKNN
jgi:hypothetical protein